MREWIPVPGTAKARLIEAALHHFERVGFESCNVTDLAMKAGVTTGSLYHHFGSKLGLYTVVRHDLEKRITDRIEGAAAAAAITGRAGEVGGPGTAVRAALLVGFDAAVRFDACRLLGESPPVNVEDSIEATVRSLLSEEIELAAPMLVAAWRAALLSVADGATAEMARAAFEYTVSPAHRETGPAAVDLHSSGG